MGNQFSKKVANLPVLVEETQLFSLWTIEDVRTLWNRFHNQICGFAIVEAQFASIMAFKDVEKHVPIEELFDVLDNDHDGRIDGLELLGGLALCCKASFEEKSKFIYTLFDFNLNAVMSEKELIIMMMSCINGYNLLTGGSEELEPEMFFFENLAKDCIEKCDKNFDKLISYDEFVFWARSNRSLMAGIEKLQKISQDAKNAIESEDSAPEVDEDYLSQDEDVISDKMKAAKIEKKFKNRILSVGKGDQSLAVSQWPGQCFEPTNYKFKKSHSDGPESNLELSWVFGYRAQKCRNNVRYVASNKSPNELKVDENDVRYDIVYYTAALAIVYNPETKSQRFYMGHSCEVTCLAMHPSQQIVATGDVKGHVHIWKGDNMQALSVIEGIVKQGVTLLSFSPKGDRIATVGKDPDHTVAIYDVSTGVIISSSKGLISPIEVFDIDYSWDGSEIVLVGKNQIKYFTGVNTNKRAIDSHVGHIGNSGKRQSFFCVAYAFSGDAMVGCGSGELYRMKDRNCVEIIQAHGINEPIMSIFFNKHDGTLLTGSKDCLIKTWDSTLKEVGVAIDMSEDVNGDGQADSGSLDCCVTSIQQINHKVLIATKGSDIYEATLPKSLSEHHSLSRVAWGHSSGELWGLAPHPLKDEFCTCGDDKTLRIWSIRSHEQINIRVLQNVARTVTYNPLGDIICIGMNDGSVALIESKSPTLRVYSTWKNSDKRINDVKFSPDGQYLATGSSDTNIYIYKSANKKDFQKQAVCRGHSGSITHLDFSSNSQYLQSNGNDYALLFWDIKGNQIKSASSLRDITWATFTCVFGWPVKGIWPDNSDNSSINTCMALPDIKDVVVGNDSCQILLYKYPVVENKALHQSYIGHAHHITCLRFTCSKRYMISLGGLDRSILLWKHEVEKVDASDDEDGNSSSSSSSGYSSAESEAESVASITSSDGKEKDPAPSPIEMAAAGPGDQSVNPFVKQWKSAFMEPTVIKNNPGSTDVDFDLGWIHGYRSHDCRNNLIYSAAGTIVYNTAALAVVYNKGTGKQNFLLGVHNDEVIGIAAHPAGQLFATSEMGKKPTIVIWNSKDMQVLNKLDNVHKTSIPLLAFNSKGNYLASMGSDSNNTVSIYDWAKGFKIFETPTDKNKVKCMTFLINNDTTQTQFSSENDTRDYLVTAGEKNIKFWWAQGQNVLSQRGLWGNIKNLKSAAGVRQINSIINCVASASPKICVTGSKNEGVLVIWKDFKAFSSTIECYSIAEDLNNIFDINDIPDDTGSNDLGDIRNLREFIASSDKANYLHMGLSIESMFAIRGNIDELEESNYLTDRYEQSARYIVADSGGNIGIWRMFAVNNISQKSTKSKKSANDKYYLLLVKYLDINNLKLKPIESKINSVCWRDGYVLIGTTASEIYEVSEDKFTTVYYHKNDKKLITAPNEKAKQIISAHSIQKNDNLITAPKNIESKKIISAHSKGEVWGLAMHPSKPIFITTGDDCMVKVWNLETNRMMSYIVLPDKARAVDIHPTNDEIALAMNSGDVYLLSMKPLIESKERSESGKNEPLDQVEVKYALNADKDDKAASDKPQTSEEASSTDTKSLTLDKVEEASKNDKTASDKPQISKEASSTDSKSSTINQEKANTIKKLQKGATRWSQVIKYSFNGSILAVGSQDKSIYLYDLSDAEKKFTLSPIKLKGHTSSITHIDFGILIPHEISVIKDSAGVDSEKIEISRRFDSNTLKIITKTVRTNLKIDKERKEEPKEIESPITKEKDIIIQSASSDYELFFWKVDGSTIKHLKSAVLVRDVSWLTYSCPFGWSVQGIWPSDDSTDKSTICAVARSHSWEKVAVVATVDSIGRLRLYNYPCPSPGAADKCYRGHSKNTTNICFSFDDKYCVTLGGTDRSVFIWTTDIQEEIRQRESYPESFGGDISEIGSNKLNIVAELDNDFSITKPILTTGDEGLAVKPWKGAIREPTDWKDSPTLTDPPNANLDLKFVYGYRGWDCRNNLNFADSSIELVYHIAGVGVVLNVEKQTQIINTEHDDDILCLSVHPEGHTVATGEIGKTPKIVLWDANTGVTITVIKFHKKGVTNIAFSIDGSMVISVGMDEDSTVAVHNVKSGNLLGKGKAGRGVKIYTLSVNSNAFITGGKNHVKFWDLPKTNSPGGELSSKTGIYSIKSVTEKTVVSSAYLGVDAVTGMNDGSILLWKERANTKVNKAHTGAVTSMCTISETANKAIDSRELGPRVLSGGKDGFIHLWNNQFVQLISIDLKASTPSSILPEIQAVAFKEDRILVGTKASEIYDLNLRNLNETFKRVQGHFMEKCEVWGLDAHPSMQRVVTCGDDKTVRLWDYSKKIQIGIVDIGSKARAVAFSPDGTQIAVGTMDGKLIILSNDLSSIVSSFTLSTNWIQTLSYSPDRKQLAVGAHDCLIYLLETKSYSCKNKFKGHHSFITGIDFSADSTKMQSVSGDYELLFWDCLTGKQILSATSMRDVKWAKCTCILGWSVQGIWPAYADGTDVNSVDRSPDGKYLVSGDDFRKVKLFQYPCPREKTQFKEYKGHSEHVMNVRFSYDGKYVFSVGGLDKSLLQFEVQIPKKK